MAENEIWRGDRRAFLKAATRYGGAGLILLNVPALGCAIASNFPGVAPRTESLEDVVSQIKVFEAQVGANPLTFEQARGYVPLLAKHFTKATDSPTPAAEFSDNTVIIRRRYATSEEGDREFLAVAEKRKSPHEVNVVRYLMEDYPRLTLSDKQARNLVSSLRNKTFFGIPAAWVSEDKMFLVLDRMNNTPSGYEVEFIQKDGSLKKDNLPSWQYLGLGIQVDCQPPTPVTNFRSTFHHESAHRDKQTEGLPLEQEVVVAYNRALEAVDFKLGPDFTKGERAHFLTRFSYDQLVSGAPVETFLDEFVADYIQATVNAQSGLPYTMAYAEPYDLANFRTILQQSGVTDPELFDYNRNSQVKELLLRIAQGAKNVAFIDEIDMLEFGVRRFLLNRTLGGGLHSRPILWNEFAPYFDGIDLRIYQYVEPWRLNYPMFYADISALPYHKANATLSCVQK